MVEIILTADSPGEQQFVATTKVMIINRLAEADQMQEHAGLRAEVLLTAAEGWIDAVIFAPTHVILQSPDRENAEYPIDQLAAIRFRE